MRSSSAPLGSVTSTRSAAASVRPVAPRLRATASSTSAVLERAPHVDVIVPPPNYADLLPSIDEDSQRGFQDYESAAQRMEDLERLSAELLQNLNELNSASEALEATVSTACRAVQQVVMRRADTPASPVSEGLFPCTFSCRSPCPTSINCSTKRNGAPSVRRRVRRGKPRPPPPRAQPHPRGQIRPTSCAAQVHRRRLSLPALALPAPAPA